MGPFSNKGSYQIEQQPPLPIKNQTKGLKLSQTQTIAFPQQDKDLETPTTQILQPRKLYAST